MKRNLQSSIFFLICLCGLLNRNLSAQTEFITVDAAQQMDTNTTFLQGFINGGASYNIPLTEKLKPSHWGFGWDVIADYDYAVPPFNPVTMASIYSAYMSYFGLGDPMLLQPWTDGYVQWDNFVTGMVTQSISGSRPVDFWSVWGEPDASFSGTPVQYAELFRRTDSLVHAVDANAKMVGPDFINYEIDDLLYFIDSMHQLNIHPAAISWHEFGNNPQDILFHVDEFRDSLVSRPFINPEIHIQEYGDPDNRQIPGWGLGWLYYFEKSKVNWASRACFNEFDGFNWWDDCWNGLSGMYMNDGVTTQPMYWVHRAYAELNKNDRLEVTSLQPRTIAMSSKNDSNNEMKIIVGRHYSPYQGFPDPNALVQITLRHYPYGNNSTQPMIIQRIPAQTTNFSTPLNAPITTFNGNITFSGDSAVISIPSFIDGDVYIILVNPDQQSILAMENAENESGLIVYPNPSSSDVHIMGLSEFNQLSLINSLGQTIFVEEIHTNEYVLSTQSLSPGIYYIRANDTSGRSKVQKLVIQ